MGCVFDVWNDPAEQTNLGPSNKELRAELRAKLLAAHVTRWEDNSWELTRPELCDKDDYLDYAWRKGGAIQPYLNTGG